MAAETEYRDETQVRMWPKFVFLRDGQVVTQLARPSHDQLEEAFRTLVG